MWPVIIGGVLVILGSILQVSKTEGFAGEQGLSNKNAEDIGRSTAFLVTYVRNNIGGDAFNKLLSGIPPAIKANVQTILSKMKVEAFEVDPKSPVLTQADARVLGKSVNYIINFEAKSIKSISDLLFSIYSTHMNNPEFSKHLNTVITKTGMYGAMPIASAPMPTPEQAAAQQAAAQAAAAQQAAAQQAAAQQAAAQAAEQAAAAQQAAQQAAAQQAAQQAAAQQAAAQQAAEQAAAAQQAAEQAAAQQAAEQAAAAQQAADQAARLDLRALAAQAAAQQAEAQAAAQQAGQAALFPIAYFPLLRTTTDKGRTKEFSVIPVGNGPAFRFGILGGKSCAVFDGTKGSKYIQIQTSDSFKGLKSFSYTYWIYTNDAGYYNSVSLTGSDPAYFGINLDQAGNSPFTLNAMANYDGEYVRAGVPTTVSTVQKWVFVAVTVDNVDSTNKIELFVDGVSKGITSTPGTMLRDYFFIGQSGDLQHGFKGGIRQFQVYSYVLTPTKINNQMTYTADDVNPDYSVPIAVPLGMGLPPPPTCPVGHTPIQLVTYKAGAPTYRDGDSYLFSSTESHTFPRDNSRYVEVTFVPDPTLVARKLRGEFGKGFKIFTNDSTLPEGTVLDANISFRGSGQSNTPNMYITFSNSFLGSKISPSTVFTICLPPEGFQNKTLGFRNIGPEHFQSYQNPYNSSPADKQALEFRLGQNRLGQALNSSFMQWM